MHPTQFIKFKGIGPKSVNVYSESDSKTMIKDAEIISEKVYKRK